MSVKRYSSRWMAIVLLGLITSGAASAACTSKGAGRNIVLNFPAFDAIDQHAEYGSVLGSVSTSNEGRVHIVCTYVPGATPNVLGYYTPLTPVGGDKTFASDIPGVGIRIKMNVHYIPIDTTTLGESDGERPLMVPQVIELIKIGEITRGGALLSDSAIITRREVSYGALLQTIRVASIPVITLAKPTCATAKTIVNVPLGSVSLADLNATGRSPEVPFSIDLTCSGGTGKSTDVYVTLTDQNNPTNNTTQLGLTPGGADGVVIEVKNKNGLVNFGADSTAPGNPGQWLEGAAGAGNFSIPLSVNYLKVGSNPTPGAANAVATYTLSYQ